MEFDEVAPVLRAVGVAEAAGEEWHLAAAEAMAAELELSITQLEVALESLDAVGLVYAPPLTEGLTLRLRRAGRQYLTRGGKVERSVLSFLPHTIDDLNARAALLNAGTIVVDEFRYAVLQDTAVDHARELVPPAFSSTITEDTAINLFAASVALMARLSDEAPAACVAEEIIAVSVLNEAEAWLEMEADDGTITPTEREEAKAELTSLFELFQDDDVLDLFDMKEPADAALAQHDPISVQMGVVDQRVGSWFRPFTWSAPTGYLSDPTGADYVRPAQGDVWEFMRGIIQWIKNPARKGTT
jgi:hypothetical protein